jgi:hypothetical protein
MSEEQTNLTLRQRKRLQQLNGDSQSESPPKRRYLRALLSVAVVALLSVSVWALFHFLRGPDPRVAEISDLMARAGKLDNPMGKEAMDLRKQIGEKMKDLPDDLKSQIAEKGRGMFQAKFDQFFGMSSADQLAELDKVILGMKAMEALQKAKEALSGATGGGSSGSSSTSNSGPGGHGGRSDAQKMQGWQKMMANIPPTHRAQWTLGRQMFNARIQQQGGTAPSGGFF